MQTYETQTLRIKHINYIKQHLALPNLKKKHLNLVPTQTFRICELHLKNS